MDVFLSNTIHFFSGSKEWIIALISGLLGAVVGAVGGGWATYYFNKKHTLALEKKQKLNLAKALSTELSSLWKRYMNIVGTLIEATNNDKPILIYFPESFRNYFVIFDNSSNLVGLFDQDIISKIVDAYINGKAFLDELIEYGKFSDRYREAASQGLITTELNDEYQALFLKFKKRHFEVKKILEEAISVLDNIRN